MVAKTIAWSVLCVGVLPFGCSRDEGDNSQSHDDVGAAGEAGSAGASGSAGAVGPTGGTGAAGGDTALTRGYPDECTPESLGTGGTSNVTQPDGSVPLDCECDRTDYSCELPLECFCRGNCPTFDEALHRASDCTPGTIEELISCDGERRFKSSQERDISEYGGTSWSFDESGQLTQAASWSNDGSTTYGQPDAGFSSSACTTCTACFIPARDGQTKQHPFCERDANCLPLFP